MSGVKVFTTPKAGAGVDVYADDEDYHYRIETELGSLHVTRWDAEGLGRCYTVAVYAPGFWASAERYP